MSFVSLEYHIISLTKNIKIIDNRFNHVDISLILTHKIISYIQYY